MGVAGSMGLMGFLALAVSVPAALVLGWLLRGQWLPQRAPALARGPHSPEPDVSLLDSLPDAMTISRNGIRLYANTAAARLLGVPSAADLIGQSVFDWVNPEELSAFSTEPRLFDDVEAVGQTIPLRCFKRDGTPFLAEIQLIPISYRGEPAVLSVTRDVTVSKAAELQLRQLALAVEQNPHSVVITDTLGRVDYANEAFLAGSGYGLGQVLGQSMSLLSSGKTPKETYRALWAALDAGRVWSGEFVNRRRDGSDYIDSAIITPLRQPNGRVTHFVAVQQDVTERHRQEEELRQHRDHLEDLVAQRTAELATARTQAELANLAKSRFLAAASHDLRQPLTALALYVGILSQPIKSPDPDLVGSMQDCVNQLGELLTDLLDVSKLDAGVIAPQPVDFSIADLLLPLLNVHGAKAREKGLQLRWRASATLVRTDVQLLNRIVGNLIDNAIEYTSHGGVLLACRRRQGRQWLEVWDTGQGIPDDQTELIFEEFRQLGDQARNRGSGLGLAIVAKAAALLKLKIRLRTCLGRGSVFAIELPPGQPPVAAAGAVAARAPATRVVALVDDNPQVLAALNMALKSLGHTVHAASSGPQLKALLGDQTPDLIVSDYRLADQETGVALIQQLRLALGATLPGIIVTGDTDPALLRSMATQGIAVLHKPVEISGLQTAILEATACASLALS